MFRSQGCKCTHSTKDFLGSYFHIHEWKKLIRIFFYPNVDTKYIVLMPFILFFYFLLGNVVRYLRTNKWVFCGIDFQHSNLYDKVFMLHHYLHEHKTNMRAILNLSLCLSCQMWTKEVSKSFVRSVMCLLLLVLIWFHWWCHISYSIWSTYNYFTTIKHWRSFFFVSSAIIFIIYFFILFHGVLSTCYFNKGLYCNGIFSLPLKTKMAS